MSDANHFTCTKCKTTKALSEYHKRSSVKRGHDSWCKICKSDYRKQYFKDNYEKEKSRARVKAWKFLGIDMSMKEYTELVQQTRNACQICKRKTQTLHVDHCHSTGKVRGLLCGSCNRALGLFQESSEVLQKALSYLNKNE